MWIKSGYQYESIYFDTPERLSSVATLLLGWADEDRIDREVVTLIEISENPEFSQIPVEFIKWVVEFMQKKGQAVFEKIEGEPSVKFLFE